MSDFRPAWAAIDLDAVRHNVSVLRSAAPSAALMAVVKANAYGHGAEQVARAALEAGAGWLGVARVAEGVELRDAGIDAPIMVLSDPPADGAGEVVSARLTPMIGDVASLGPLADAARAARTPLDVHVKVDTGMHRIGCSPAAVRDVVDRLASEPSLHFAGIGTHLAVADAVGDPFTDRQLDEFLRVLDDLESTGDRPPLAHAANSAGLLAHPRSHLDLVRTGISVYGLAPGKKITTDPALRPAMSLHARVSAVRDLDAGERVSYGRRYELSAPGRIATVPLGYADGVPRRLADAAGDVLVGGTRRPVAGTVTMDQMMVDVGSGPVDVGDEVVLIGSQDGPDGSDTITATEWADRLGTIDYEIVTGIRSRVPRTYSGG
ncbi:MAG: alanine racemase [Acidimicrobiia bacterium]|nr:alanine racemase [Acidimicrobiia bacterium]